MDSHPNGLTQSFALHQISREKIALSMSVDMRFVERRAILNAEEKYRLKRKTLINGPCRGVIISPVDRNSDHLIQSLESDLCSRVEQI